MIRKCDGSGKVFILGGKCFICIVESKSPGIDSWGTPHLTVTQLEKNSGLHLVVLFQFFVFHEVESKPVRYCFLNAINM
jgi:hypothetical protein